MNITLEMIMTKFSEFQPDVVVSYDFNLANIRGVQLLPKITEGIPGDFLYVTASRKKLSLYLSEDGLCIFNLPESVLPLAEGFNSLIRSYEEFIEWDRQLDFALYKEASFQDFLDISDRLFRCPLLIYDPALKLLAYSKSYENIDDKIFQNAIKNGFLNHEDVNYFLSSHTFDDIDAFGQASGDADSVRMHSDNIRSIKMNNQVAIYCIILYTNQYSKSYLTALFDNLINTLENLMQKKLNDFVRNRSVTDYFLMDLLDNPATPAHQIKERNYHNDLDYEGNYLVIRIFSDHIKFSSSDYYVQMLRNIMTNCQVFFYKSGIVILYIIPPMPYLKQKDYLLKNLSPLSNQFSDINLRIFASRTFKDLSYFSNCYRQTEKMSEFLTEGGIYFYDDYSTNCLLHSLEPSYNVYNLCHPVILDLFNQDTKKSRQLLKLLKLYLNFERNITKTADALGMHRNNVIYHIGQFEEHYGLDLDDADTRLSLILSFMIIDSHA